MRCRYQSIPSISFIPPWLNTTRVRRFHRRCRRTSTTGFARIAQYFAALKQPTQLTLFKGLENAIDVHLGKASYAAALSDQTLMITYLMLIETISTTTTAT